MFLVRMIRKLFSLLRSNLTAHEIALGFCLGILAGGIPFSSVWAMAAVVLIVLAVRSSFSSFLLALIVVKALSFLLLPVLFSLGEYALDGPLSGIFAAAATTPGLALLDPHRYVVAGALLFALCAAVPAYIVIYVAVNRYRLALIGWSEKSPRYNAITGSAPIRFLTWLFMGKKGDYAAAAEAHRSFFRKGALILLACFAALIWIVGFFFGNALTGMGIEAGLSAALDAQVFLEDTNIGFVNGKLSLNRLIVQEYEKKGKKGEITEVTYFEGDLNVTELLRRHLVFEKIDMGQMTFSARRDAEGRFNLGEPRRKKKRPRPEDAPDDEGLLPHVGDLWDQEELARDIVERLLDWLFPPEETAEEAARREEERQKAAEDDRYLDLYAFHLLGRERPAVVIEDLWIRKLDLTLDDDGTDRDPQRFTGLTLHATNLSSNPVLLGKTSQIELFSGKDWDSAGFRLRLFLNWHSPDQFHTLNFDVIDLPTENFTTCLDSDDRFVVNGGTISMTSRSTLDINRINSENELALRNLVFSPGRDGKSILGLEPDLFCTGITEYFKTNPLTLKASLSGAYTSPRLDINEEELLRVVAEGIRNTGQKILMDEFEKQKGKVLDEIAEEKAKLEQKGREKVDEATKELQEKMDEKINKKLDDFFGRKKDRKKDK